jgi:hypothetical protein
LRFQQDEPNQPDTNSKSRAADGDVELAATQELQQIASSSDWPVRTLTAAVTTAGSREVPPQVPPNQQKGPGEPSSELNSNQQESPWDHWKVLNLKETVLSGGSEAYSSSRSNSAEQGSQKEAQEPSTTGKEVLGSSRGAKLAGAGPAVADQRQRPRSFTLHQHDPP